MAAKIEFIEFVPAEKVNEYIDTVKELAALDNPNAGIVITVPAEDVQKETFKFQKAANLVNKTAKRRVVDLDGATVIGQDEDGKDILSGYAKITFTLMTKHKARRKNKTEESK